MNTFTIFLVLITIVCLLLVVVIMIQNPKGGGLDSSFGGSTVVGGVKNTNEFLEKSTWVLSALLIILVLFSSVSIKKGGAQGSKILDSEATQEVVIPKAPMQPDNSAAPSNSDSDQAPATNPEPEK